jgi:alkanesulfonate monooxygenase SsuD/methylene tetrahydromethanopterin reductase-like flavin-dependent oxidoreductase (luciferase family)
VKTRPEHQTWEEIRDAWIAADEIPLFESAWNWDHFYPLSGDLTGPNFEAWTMLAALAQATRRIRLGCQVTGMVYRHPAVLANMAATVDIISGGRLELGLGAGWNQMECDAYGIDLPPLRERFDRFDEGVEAIVGLLSQTTTTFAGQYVKLTDARCEPKPVQRPHPPVTIGGTAVERDRPGPGRVAGAQGGAGRALRRDRARRERDHLLGQRAHRPGNGPGASRRRGNRLSRRRR